MSHSHSLKTNRSKIYFTLNFQFARPADSRQNLNRNLSILPGACEGGGLSRGRVNAVQHSLFILCSCKPVNSLSLQTLIDKPIMIMVAAHQGSVEAWGGLVAANL